MKKTIIAAALITASAAFAAARTDAMLRKAEQAGWSEERKFELSRLGDAADEANAAFREFCASNGLSAAPAVRVPLKAKPKEDPTLEAIRADAKKHKVRFQTLSKTVRVPAPASSNLVRRAARSSSQEKINEAREQARLERAVEKANKKASKSRAKIVKAIEKERDKASDADEAALYQALLDILRKEPSADL